MFDLNIELFQLSPSTYDHRLERTGHPVRSAIHKLQIGGLVVGSVTTSEYPLLYVFAFLLFCLKRLQATSVCSTRTELTVCFSTSWFRK
jgi:hypothetical protein